MNHVFSIDFKYNNGEIGHTKIIINTECENQFFLWRCALGEAYQLVERAKADLLQIIKLS